MPIIARHKSNRQFKKRSLGIFITMFYYLLILFKNHKTKFSTYAVLNYFFYIVKNKTYKDLSILI